MCLRLPPEILKALEDADDQENETSRANGIASLSAWLDQNQKGKTHTPTDPNKLPFRTPDSKARTPIETEQGFKTSLFRQKPVHLAGPIPAGFTLPATTLPATPAADDLAATEDIVITPAIQALADSLNKNPVKIYNWVHNNIEFLPTYGSIPAQQIIQITALTLFTVAANVGAAWLGLFFAAPITGVALAITLSLVLAFINTWVNEQIMGLEI